MKIFKKRCKRCVGYGYIIHPVEPKSYRCKKCKGKGTVWKWKKQ